MQRRTRLTPAESKKLRESALYIDDAYGITMEELEDLLAQRDFTRRTQMTATQSLQTLIAANSNRNGA